MSEIKGQFSSKLANYYQTDKLLWAISSMDVHHHRHKMALSKKFILLPPLRSPESFYATYRGPWPLVKKWPLVYLQTTKKPPKSISVARTYVCTDDAKTISLRLRRGIKKSADDKKHQKSPNMQTLALCLLQVQNNAHETVVCQVLANITD